MNSRTSTVCCNVFSRSFLSTLFHRCDKDKDKNQPEPLTYTWEVKKKRGCAWTDYDTKSSKSNIKTRIKEWKAQQVEPAPYMLCHLREIIKNERKKKQHCYFWRISFGKKDSKELGTSGKFNFKVKFRV